VDPLLVLCHVERGDLDAARAALSAVERIAGSEGIARGFVLEARGRLALAEHRPGDALADLLAAGGHLEACFGIDVSPLCSWRSWAALAAAALGDAEQASALADAGVARARDVGTLAPLGVALTTAGLVSEGPRSEALLCEAVAVVERSPNRLEHGRALVALGRAWRKAGQVVRARESLSTALDLADGVGAAALADVARSELRAAGARPRRTARYGVAALTPTELRIVEAAAGGLSNKDIAQQLFVTAKTVEWHLAHAYRKLGIRSRGLLVEVLPMP
jgi:DNA-binding CsgD family transcriptional regulator